MTLFQQTVLGRETKVRTGGGAGGGEDPLAPCQGYAWMAPGWDLIDSLRGGTDMMRASGEKWLPKHERESPAQYKDRLSMSFLYNALEDTVERLASKPFIKPVTIKGEDKLDPRLQSMIHDMDRNGTSITQFALNTLRDMMYYGKSHTFVDFPNIPTDLNLAEENAIKARPVALLLDPRDVIGWRGKTISALGEEELDQVRFYEYASLPTGLYGEQRVETVKVVNKDGSFSVHQLGQDQKPMKVTEGRLTISRLPFVTAYSNRVGFMRSRSPFRALAEYNVQHWQSSSDQNNILHFARIPMLAQTGISAEEVESETVISPRHSFKSTDPQSKYFFVEHSGAAIAAGDKHLQRTEERMETLGNQPLTDRAGPAQTATGKAIDAAKTDSILQRWIRAVEDNLEKTFKLAAEWIGVQLPEEFAIDIFSDFSIGSAGDARSTLLLQMRQAGEIDRATFLNEMRRNGTLDESLKVEDIMEALESEPPPANPFGDLFAGNKKEEPPEKGGPPQPPFVKK